VITRLRNMKDEDENWSRWRDVVFLAKGRLAPKNIMQRPLPPQNRRQRGGSGWADNPKKLNAAVELEVKVDTDTSAAVVVEDEEAEGKQQLTTEEALARLTAIDPDPDAPIPSAEEQEKISEDVRYCQECYLPLHPDPKPEKLYIFLHALRYTTSLGVYETEMPEWAVEGWEWDRTA